MDSRLRNPLQQRRPAPSPAAPLIKMTCELSCDEVRCQPNPQLLYGLITLRAQDSAQHHTQRINLCLVLDRSSSMRGEKIDQVKEAVRQVIAGLDAGDYISIIAFSDKAEIVVPCQQEANHDEVGELLRELQPRGGTEIAQGIEAGLNEMRIGAGEGRINHMILLTDGHTYGDEERCRELATAAAKEQISITTLGVGAEWNDALLGSIASQSRGMLEYIDQPERIVKVFNEQVERLRNILVVQAAIRLRKPEAIQIRYVGQITPHIEHIDNKESIAIGTLGRNEERSYLIEFVLPGQEEPARMALAEIELTYLPAQVALRAASLPGRTNIQARARLDAGFVTAANPDDPDQPSPNRSELNQNVVHALECLMIFRLQERAWSEAKQGDIVSATGHLNMSASHLASMGATDMARRVWHEADQLASTGTVSLTNHKQVHYGTRGLRLPAGIERQQG